ncbi:reverse transcriptase domain-containing protein [Tanacetum coccineum]
MRTRSQSREQRPPPPEGPPVVIEPLRIEYPFQEDPTVEPMADTRTMAQLLQAPTEGYEDAILIPEIVANNFELKHGLINLVQNKQFFGHDKEDPHAHIRYFNKITSTMRVPNVPIATIKLMLFPFSIEGAARIWLEKEPPRSIQTWDDLVSKFINQFFPPSKTTNLRNEITRFQQRFDESFYEAWDRFNDLLRACPHHGFSELHQLDTFYNALNINDQDSLNSAAGGNFLDKMPRECLKIIESKSKVRQTRAKAVVAKVSTNSSTQAVSPDVAELKDIVRALLLDKKNQASAPAPAPAPAPVKAVELSCVTCGAPISPNCPSTMATLYRTTFLTSTFRSGTHPGHTVTNPDKNLRVSLPKAVVVISMTSNSNSSVVEAIPEVTKTKLHLLATTYRTPTTSGRSEPITNSSFHEPIEAPVVAPCQTLNFRFSPYPSRRDNERDRNQLMNKSDTYYEYLQRDKFRRLAIRMLLFLMPKFATTLRSLTWE